jgi:hypothetical protein
MTAVALLNRLPKDAVKQALSKSARLLAKRALKKALSKSEWLLPKRRIDDLFGKYIFYTERSSWLQASMLGTG